MLAYEQAKNVAIANTINGGKVYYAGDAGNFYVFIIVKKNFPLDIKGPMFGSTFTAVDKSDGKVWTISVGDSRLKDVKPIVRRGERV